MSKWTYYNENDPFAAQWLRELIKAKLISDGEVDARDIQQVQPEDLKGFRRCHFFAGIGGWDYALQLAGWNNEEEIWTGSCPCQPFSCAGKGKGVDDERHLWPEFFRLIKECRPSVVVGEQVVGSKGYAWLDLVFADMEKEDYACGSATLCAYSVKAPQKRLRSYWVAESAGNGREGLQRKSQPQVSKNWTPKTLDAWNESKGQLAIPIFFGDHPPDRL